MKILTVLIIAYIIYLHITMKKQNKTRINEKYCDFEKWIGIKRPSAEMAQVGSFIEKL